MLQSTSKENGFGANAEAITFQANVTSRQIITERSLEDILVAVEWNVEVGGARRIFLWIRVLVLCELPNSLGLVREMRMLLLLQLLGI